MPNTKSAAKRVRSSARKAAQNKSVKSRVRTMERKFTSAVASGKADEAQKAIGAAASAYGKAAKTGVIKAKTAQRKRSRLQLALNRLQAKPGAK
jgi:small subunit ribosomal protein S20